MFDNPQEQLKELEEQLLAAENNKDEKFERLYSELLRDYGPEQVPDEEVFRNYANSYGKKPSGSPRQAPVTSYTDTRPEPEEHRDHSITALTVIICVELLGIAGVIAWWAFRLLSHM